MTLPTTIKSWQDISLEHLFYAYRKAKADSFRFTDVLCLTEKIVDFERDLAANLTSMLNALKSGGARELLFANLGSCRFVAKKLNVGSSVQPTATHAYFSDPERAFANLQATTDGLCAEFRLIGDFPMAMHVMSALWVNLIGPKFDSSLSANAYGSRLRRYRSSDTDATSSQYHLESIGSFQPYFTPYRHWRENGLRAIRNELNCDKPVIAVSMDLASYYHNIDPTFISNPAFHKTAKIALNDFELSFCQIFVEALREWGKKVASWAGAHGCAFGTDPLGGLPIGLSMARVAANAFLVELDREIEQELAPVYYGRYVDDIFLVLRDPGNLITSEDVLRYISSRAPVFKLGGPPGDVRIALSSDYLGQSELWLKQSKQKLFFLQGQAGIDLLSNIETQIRSVSSERRMMPSPQHLERMASAKILTAAGHASEEADTLRKADGLAVRRLGWSIQLRAVEILSRDLRQRDWQAERYKFYEFARSHILRPDKILDHIDYLPRLLAIAVSLMDWTEANRLLKAAIRSIDALKSGGVKKAKINGETLVQPSPTMWDALHESILEIAADTVLRSLRWTQAKGGARPLSAEALALCESVGLGSDQSLIHARSLAIREIDWAKVSYKDHVQRDATRQRPAQPGEDAFDELYAHSQDLRHFLHASTQNDTSTAARINVRCLIGAGDSPASRIPYYFPTRPYSTQEISLFLPDECVFGSASEPAASAWARYVRAVRGVWVKPSALVAEEQNSNKNSCPNNWKLARIGVNTSTEVRIGVSSLLTPSASHNATASGKSDISNARYDRIRRVVNQAIRAHPRPTHLLLPELSLPERWLETVATLLRDSGISLISGMDYRHGTDGEVHSETALMLTDDRLGFRASVQIRQPKATPAAGEEYELLRIHGKRWTECLRQEPKPIYVHNGFAFGVLVCSELQNIGYRHHFQGKVDSLIVLSWNRDLDTFSSLVESASLDVHSYVVLVNNRQYGDSRVRAPIKEQFGRDLCRLRGGENEQVTVVGLDYMKLRSFQSRAKNWPTNADPFKPVPEGYNIAPYRFVRPT